MCVHVCVCSLFSLECAVLHQCLMKELVEVRKTRGHQLSSPESAANAASILRVINYAERDYSA